MVIWPIFTHSIPLFYSTVKIVSCKQLKLGRTEAVVDVVAGAVTGGDDVVHNDDVEEGLASEAVAWWPWSDRRCRWWRGRCCGWCSHWEGWGGPQWWCSRGPCIWSSCLGLKQSIFMVGKRKGKKRFHETCKKWWGRPGCWKQLHEPPSQDWCSQYWWSWGTGRVRWWSPWWWWWGSFNWNSFNTRQVLSKYHGTHLESDRFCLKITAADKIASCGIWDS